MFSDNVPYPRRGYAKAMVSHLVEQAMSEPEVELLRATTRPDNEASLATLKPFSFVQVGEQWDEGDGI